MKLLPRLYEPENGRIFIDDYDISKVNLSSLRRQVELFPKAIVIQGTIAKNIALNDPEADDESIMQTAKMACAHGYYGLGQRYATKIAERGSNYQVGNVNVLQLLEPFFPIHSCLCGWGY